MVYGRYICTSWVIQATHTCRAAPCEKMWTDQNWMPQKWMVKIENDQPIHFWLVVWLPLILYVPIFILGCIHHPN